jgi:hypothetical protein
MVLTLAIVDLHYQASFFLLAKFLHLATKKEKRLALKQTVILEKMAQSRLI